MRAQIGDILEQLNTVGMPWPRRPALSTVRQTKGAINSPYVSIFPFPTKTEKGLAICPILPDLLFSSRLRNVWQLKYDDSCCSILQVVGREYVCDVVPAALAVGDLGIFWTTRVSVAEGTGCTLQLWVGGIPVDIIHVGLSGSPTCPSPGEIRKHLVFEQVLRLAFAS